MNFDSWVSDIETSPGADLPLSIGRMTRAELDMSEEIGQTIEDQTLHELHEGIQKQQYQYLIEEAGAFHEYDGIDATHRAKNELRSNDYGHIPDNGKTTCLWVFHPETAHEVAADADEVFRRGPRTLQGYPIHSTHAMPEDRFALVDVEALIPNRARYKQPLTDYAPSDQFTVTVPRPWLVKDPMGVVVVEYPNA